MPPCLQPKAPAAGGKHTAGWFRNGTDCRVLAKREAGREASGRRSKRFNTRVFRWKTLKKGSFLRAPAPVFFFTPEIPETDFCCLSYELRERLRVLASVPMNSWQRQHQQGRSANAVWRRKTDKRNGVTPRARHQELWSATHYCSACKPGVSLGHGTAFSRREAGFELLPTVDLSLPFSSSYTSSSGP